MQKSITERITDLINAMGENPNSFSTKIGIAQSTVATALKRNKGVNSDFVEKITIAYPMINIDWLLTGKEPMFKSDIANPQPYIKENLVRVPYVPSSAYASFVDSLYGIDSELDYFEVVSIDGFNLLDGSWLVFDVKGDSMSPTIQEGSKILCQRIDEGKWETASGVVVIVYGKTLTVKRILLNDIYLNNRLVLKADNELHGQVDIPLESIRGMWQAVRVVDSVIK